MNLFKILCFRYFIFYEGKLRREKQENYAPIFQRRNLQQTPIKVESRQNISNIIKCRLIIAKIEEEK